MMNKTYLEALDYAKAYIHSLDPDSDFVETPEKIFSQVQENWYVDLYDSVIDGLSQIHGDEWLDKLSDKELKKLKAFIYTYALKYHFPEEAKDLMHDLVEEIRVSQ